VRLGATFVARSRIEGGGGGLFASRRFEEKEVIGLYVGKNIAAGKLSDFIVRRGYVLKWTRGFLDTFNTSGRLQLLSGVIVDTNSYSSEDWERLPALGVGWVGTGSLARFANHSSRCNARIKGLKIVAKGAISPGEEITVNYGRGYWAWRGSK
jgi:hypothetical protein